MENVIYNELRIRGYLVDVGVVEHRLMKDGKSVFSVYEVDFIATNGMDKFYIQSAYALPTEARTRTDVISQN